MTRKPFEVEVRLTAHRESWLILELFLVGNDEIIARMWGNYEHAARLNHRVCEIEREIEARKAARP